MKTGTASILASGKVRVLATLAILGTLLVAAAADAGVVTRTYTFTEPTVAERGGEHAITMAGAWSHGEPGLPVLPMVGASILLPPGERLVDVEVVPGEYVILPGSYRVPAGQRQVPLSYDGPVEVDAPDPAVYGSDSPWPGRLNDEARVGLFRGYRIASFAMHPVAYRPATGELSWLRSVTVRLHTEPDAGAFAETERRIRHDDRTMSRLAGMVDNPMDAAAYAGIDRLSGGRSLDPLDDYNYLIITTESWDDYLQPLVDFETERGHKAGVFLKSWILSEYAGADEQACIRNFIIDAYETWNVDYVLLVGDARDTNGIPHRGFYANAYGTTDSDIPADMYYGALDGNWNTDGDGYWGEASEADLYIEIPVGRACVDTQADVENFVTKTLRYLTQPIVAECDEALMAGELLWDDPTWGGDYKDEIKNGSSAHGYTTVGFPATMNVGTLYDRNGTWSFSTLISMMESGLNIVNHLGHCNVDYAMKMYNSNIPEFDNDGTVHTYNFVYSQGCYCGSFDNRNSYGSYEGDCYAETFTCDDDGAVAVLMNSRYGWGQHSSTDGSSQYFDRQFFDAMFGEQIYPIGDANDDSKMDNIWSIDYGANRWCYYEVTLFGDPAMELWTAEPGLLDVTTPGVVYIGAPDAEFTVSAQGGGPVAGARVTIWTDDYAVYDTGVTNAFGAVTLHPNADDVADMHVTVTAHDFLAWAGIVPIVPPAGPYLVYDGVTVLDAAGDDDGILDAGEDVSLAIAIENVGVDPTSGVSVVLTCTDDYVTVTDDTQSYPDIPAGSYGICYEPFTATVAGDAPEGHMVRFDVTITANEGNWDGHFYLPVQAPLLYADGLTVNDVGGGDGSGNADAGETFFLQCRVANDGSSDAEQLIGHLVCLNMGVVVHGADGTCALVPVDGFGFVGNFQVEVLPGFAEPGWISLHLSLENGAGFAAGLDYELAVGGWLDDMESERGWTVGAAGDAASSGIWTRVDPVGTDYNGHPIQPENDHSAMGTLCWVTGNTGVGGAAGDNDVDGGKTTLLTPVFDLEGATAATVSYWRWYSNAWGNDPDNDWWNVDATGDGINWVSLEHTMTTDASWVEKTFDLTSYVTLTGAVQLRFVAADEGTGSLVEAGVDDFLLTAFLPPVTAVPEDEIAGRIGILSCAPNPFNPKATIVYRVSDRCQVSLCVFDVRGRKVRTLVSGAVGAGDHQVVFDGLDDHGRALASGLYFAQLRTPTMMQYRKMTLLK
jgi:hypothetical protein